MKYDERETTFTHDFGDKDAHLTTSEPRMLNKIRRLIIRYPEQVHIERDFGDDLWVTIPYSWFSIRPKREVSDDRKAEASERFKNMWAERKENKE